MKKNGPARRELASELGDALAVWDGIVAAIEGRFGLIDREWKPSKTTFGWVHLLKHKKRTLLYLIPESGKLQVAVVLGERAVALALRSDLPEAIKALIKEARPYVEGRGIRFVPTSEADVAVVRQLVEIKTTPK